MRPGTTLLLILVFATAALASTLVVLKTWLLERRMPRVAGGWATCTTTLLLIGLFAAQYSAPDPAPEYGVLRRVPEHGAPDPAAWSGLRRAPKDGAPDPVPRHGATDPVPQSGISLRWVAPFDYIPQEQTRVDEMHRQFAPALERYRQTQGKYPPALADAGIATPMTRYGPLYYYSSRSKSEPWYLISFGDIERDRFSADWDSRSRQWSVVELDF